MFLELYGFNIKSIHGIKATKNIYSRCWSIGNFPSSGGANVGD